MYCFSCGVSEKSKLHEKCLQKSNKHNCGNFEMLKNHFYSSKQTFLVEKILGLGLFSLCDKFCGVLKNFIFNPNVFRRDKSIKA